MYILIRYERFIARIESVDALMELDLHRLRKLWKLMFGDPQNRDAVETVQAWLPKNETFMKQQYEETGTGKAQLKKARKMQTLFNELYNKYWRI